MKIGKAFIIFVCLCILLTGCGQSSDIEGNKTIHYEAPEELKIFIVSDAVHEYYQSEDRENTYYTTMMSLGDFEVTTTTYGEEGFMFHDAFAKYQEETGIKLDIHWYERTFTMEEELAKLSESEQPDLIISTNATTADYYRYMEEGNFYDLTELFEQHEIYSGEQYYNQILKAGEYEQKQYIVPLLFNVDTIMGSKEKWKEMDFHVSDITNHSELLDALIYAQQQGNVEQVATQFVSVSAMYLPYSIYSSSGERWIDHDNRTVNLDEELFRKMGIFYQQYIEEQFEEELIPGERIPWANTKHASICKMIENEVQLSDFMDGIGCFVEGGGSFQTYLHSAAAQAWYYESRYRDMKNEFEIYAMPGINGGTTAHVSYLGMVHQSSKHPEAAFDFLKYLMDSEVPAFFGLSVNREITDKQLEYLTNTSYYLRPGLQIRLEDGSLADSEADYLIQPMTAETRDKIEAIIEDIETVTLPNWPVYDMIERQLQSYVKGECSIEEAYEKAMEGLNQYIR